jgi:hypothetical protein
MGHLSPDELHQLLVAANERVVVGATYAHYKGQQYTVTGLAILEATNEPAVIYRADYDLRLTFIRPLAVWLETVEVDGTVVPRFAQVK